MVMKDKLRQLYEALDGHAQLLIIPHNDPDPDAIAAAVGLGYLVRETLGIDARIRYRGIIGRAENKALVRYLNQPLRKLRFGKIEPEIPVALVDTQPGAGNNPLPKHFAARIVIDHHNRGNASSQTCFMDVRPEMGSTTSIVTEYLRTANLDIPSSLATALFYGIKSDTMGLGRGASPKDAEVYFYLLPRIDVDALVNIERAQVPATYFKSLMAALQATRLYDRDLVISYLGVLNYPDLGAEIADLLLRLRDVKWVICMGVYKRDLILSVRSRSHQIGAGDLVLQIVGDLGTAGGHGTMAGGQIRLNQHDPFSISEELTKKAIEVIKGVVSSDGKPLI